MTPPRPRGALPLLAVVWFLGWRVLGAGSTAGTWWAHLGLVLAGGAAAVACGRRARRSQTAPHAWGYLSAAAGVWAAGQLLWLVVVQALGQRTVLPSPMDVGCLVAVPLLVTALLRLPTAPTTATARRRVLLDGLLVGASVSLAGWIVVLRGAVDALGASAGAGTPGLDPRLQLLFPVGDVLCATVALHVLARARRGTPVPVRALLLLAAGVVLYALTDTVLGLLMALGADALGSPAPAGWLVAFLLLLAAARTPERERDAAGALEGTARVGALAPTVAVALGLGASTLSALTTGRTDAVTALGTAAVVVLLLLRQALALREDDDTTAELEHRVRTRTAALATRERHHAALLANLTDAVVVLDVRGSVVWCSSSCAALGLPAAALLGAPPAAWWPASDARALLAALELGQPRATLVGGVRWDGGATVEVEAVLAPLEADLGLGAFLLTLRDVRERAALQRELTRQALHDELTGLANRTLFHDRLEQALAAAPRTGSSVSVVLLDLDGFKGVNDSLGHHAGDLVLCEVAARLRACTRAGDTVARLGGDEFAVLLHGHSAASEAEQAVRRLSSALLEPVLVEGRPLTSRASCGIAVSTGTESAEDLVRNADLAMYAAKARSSGTYLVFEPAMHEVLVARLALEDDLRGALARGEMEVWYQPTLRLGDGRWSSCEALVRWNHPTRGLVPPLDFIPLAEQTGLIVELGAWVLQQACAQTQRWRTSRPELAGLGIAVNVSGRQLAEPGFQHVVATALQDSGLPAAALVLELTESMLVDHDDALVELLRSLKDLGLRLAIDDFGTGYSSLAYLHRFPVDILKVDRSFVARMTPGSDEEELTRTIVHLGRALGLSTVAEGIEDGEQLDALRTMGCTHGQGYLFSRPVPVGELDGWASPTPTPTPALPGPRTALPAPVPGTAG